eukprot:1416459-Alexandrium_andersonii.AAC.1
MNRRATSRTCRPSSRGSGESSWKWAIKAAHSPSRAGSALMAAWTRSWSSTSFRRRMGRPSPGRGAAGAGGRPGPAAAGAGP